MYNPRSNASEYNQLKGVFMSNFLKGLVVFAISTMLISGCAKDQVKPDEGLAPSASQSTNIPASAQKASADQSAADRAAAEKAAADRAAAEKAAADRAAAEKAAADRAAAEKAAADKAAETALKMVNFDFDSYVLTKPARDILYNNADFLLKKYKGKVKIE